MVLEIIVVGNDILTAPNEKVEDIDEVKDLIADLKETLQTTNENGLGLAAPQIAVNKQVLVMKEGLESHFTLVKNKEVFAMINPEIVKKYPKTGLYREGCMSIPDAIINVERCKDIKVKYTDETGKVITRRFEGIDAVVAQHEIDHLNGILANDPRRAVHISYVPKKNAEVPVKDKSPEET